MKLIVTIVFYCLRRLQKCNSFFPLKRKKGIPIATALVALAILPACTSVNTFPMIARAGDTVSVMVGGSEKARKETIGVTLTDINNQVWDLKALGLVRSVFNLRTDGRAYGQHYSSYSDSFISWAYGHEPMQTVLVADLPAGVAPGQASLSVALNTTDNSSGVASPFIIGLEVMPGTGSADSFLRRSPAAGSLPVDFGKLEPAPHAKISFGSGTTAIGAASLVVDFNETVVNPNDINVFVPESAVRGSYSTTGAFGKTQRMVYWRQDGLKLFLDVVAPQGIEPKYLKVYMVHPKGLTGSPGFSLVSSTVYDVNGSAIVVNPTLEYFP
jgi:hypothetical protein